MSELSDLIRNKPYSFRPLKQWWQMNWLCRTEFGVFFEDTMIRTTNMDYENLKEFVSLMNCAWQMGAGSGWATGSMDLEDEITKLKAEIKKLSEATVYVLESFDRWDEFQPWDIVGYATSKEEADAWVEESKKYKECAHRYKIVERKK